MAKQERQNPGSKGQPGKAESWLQWPSRDGIILAPMAKQGMQNPGSMAKQGRKNPGSMAKQGRQNPGSMAKQGRQNPGSTGHKEGRI